MNTQLLCTFTTTKGLDQTLTDIQKNFTIVFEKIYVLQNENNINELSTEELNALEKYKNTIRSTIQAFAMANYPKKLQRRKIQGTVQLIFKLNNDGSILSVIDGPNTDAPEELIDAAAKALINSGPFESNELLKENNEFSIDIIYKIQ